MEDSKIQKRVVGVDISTETTTYAIVDVRGNIIAEADFPTTDYPNINDFVTVLCERIIELVEANGGYESIRSVGISCPSANYVTGNIVNAPNLSWKGVVPLSALIRDRLGLAVGISNDAHAAALGEHAYGAAHGMKDFILVNVGVGLGSCFFSNGNEHHGAEGYAGEFGHTCLIPGGRRCGCGKQGCIEAYVASKGVVVTAHEVMEESDKPSLMRDISNLTPREITECCKQGDELAIEVYRRTGELLGLGLANYASIVNPEAIIISGGISRAGRFLMEPAKAAFEDHVFHNIRGKVKIQVSSLDNRERDVLGASAVAWVVKEYSLFK
jgi:glucokinase